MVRNLSRKSRKYKNQQAVTGGGFAKREKARSLKGFPPSQRASAALKHAFGADNMLQSEIIFPNPEELKLSRSLYVLSSAGYAMIWAVSGLVLDSEAGAWMLI